MQNSNQNSELRRGRVITNNKYKKLKHFNNQTFYVKKKNGGKGRRGTRFMNSLPNKIQLAKLNIKSKTRDGRGMGGGG